MGDGFGIDRVRRRDWVLDDEPEAEPVGAPKSERHAGVDTCTEFDDYRTHDFDRCVFDINPGGLGERFKPSQTFLKRKDEGTEISHGDVRQGRLGDCHLLAPLAALASTPEGQALIKHAIQEHRNGTGEVTSYTVTLYDRPLLRPWALEKNDVVVPAGVFVVGHARAPHDDAPVYEVWPLVIEKAYAQLRHGYNVIAKDASPSPGIEAVTGTPATHYGPGAVPESVWADPRAVVVLSTRADIGKNDFDLEKGHAYALVERVSRGQRVVQLYNPWGTAQPKPMPISELSKWFSGIDVGSVTGAP